MVHPLCSYISPCRRYRDADLFDFLEEFLPEVSFWSLMQALNALLSQSRLFELWESTDWAVHLLGCCLYRHSSL